MKKITFLLPYLLFVFLSLNSFAQTINFDAESFVENVDYGSATYTNGNVRIILSAGNWYEDEDSGESASQALTALYYTGLETVTLETTDGAEFDFQSFFHDGYAAAFIDKVEGFKNTVSTGAKTTGFVDGVNILGGTIFDDVDKVVITSNAGFYSAFDSFVLGAPTLGLEKELLENAISLYPNPVKNELTIKTNTIEIQQAILYDILGKSIKQINVENEVVDLSSISNGIYLLKLVADKGVLVKKITKQ
tara:strand:+ start:865 stop:1611 length:747 start_codon:yes stop_codon:yes gene_type:complete